MTTFPIAPAESRYLWFIVPLALLLLGVLALLFYSIRGARNASFEVRPDGLALSGDLYGRFIPKQELKIDLARRVDFNKEPELKPSWRRMGTGLPGYQAGWFSLHNGEKALLFLTDRTRAVYLPTELGYSLLLSPQDPDEFLQALRKLGSTPASQP